MPEESPITVMREKLDDQPKLNFSLNLSLASLCVNLIAETSSATSNKNFDRTTLQLNKLTSKLEINAIFQKLEFKLKKISLLNEASRAVNNSNESNNLEHVIINNEPDRPYLKTVKSPKTVVSRNFIDITITRVLLSNLNKKLEYYSPLKSFSQMPSNSPSEAGKNLKTHMQRYIIAP